MLNINIFLSPWYNKEVIRVSSNQRTMTNIFIMILINNEQNNTLKLCYSFI